jgi:hypothetical protein
MLTFIVQVLSFNAMLACIVLWLKAGERYGR